MKFSVALPMMIALILPSVAIARPPLTDFKFSLTTGADFSSGDYGLPLKTNILVAPLALRVVTGRFRLSAAIPYLRIDSPGGVVVGPDGNPLPGVPAASGVRSGIGDLSLGATYALLQESDSGVSVDVGGRVKFPTSAKSKGLGTGKTDFSGSVDISRTFGAITPFVTLGYRVLGDPAGYNLRSGPTASIGASAPVGKAVFITSYDYSRAASPLAKDSHELFGAFSGPVARNLALTGYGTAGLSKGAPDFGVGLLLTAKL
jgi:hypothetical protein